MLDRSEYGDWLVVVRRDGDTLFGAEAAARVDALIGLADEMGA